jgi:hypothetical protein
MFTPVNAKYKVVREFGSSGSQRHKSHYTKRVMHSDIPNYDTAMMILKEIKRQNPDMILSIYVY